MPLELALLTANLIVLAVAVVLWIRSRSRLRRHLAERTTALRERETALVAREAEIRALADGLPALLAAAARDGSPAPRYRPARAELIGTPFGEAARAIAETATGAVTAERDRARHTTQSTLLAVARSLAGAVNRQQIAITEMTARHDAPEVLGDLMEIDHTTSQVLRRVQAIVVACESWPGQQHEATPLYDVVRGAVGRILDYRRVEVADREGSRAVIGRAVEGLVLAVAELLENATRYSAPHTTVQVQFQLAHTGVSIVIDDAGVGLKPGERELAARRLSGTEPVDVTGLGHPPKFGFAVIGALAARYGFTVSVESVSPFGGVRAVVYLPTAILTDLDETPRGARVLTREEPVAAVAAPAPAPAVPGVTTAGGLPKRSRRAASGATADTGATPAVRDPRTEAARTEDRHDRAAHDGAAQDRTGQDRAARDRSAQEAAAPLAAFVRGSRAVAEPSPAPTREGTSDA